MTNPDFPFFTKFDITFSPVEKPGLRENFYESTANYKDVIFGEDNAELFGKSYDLLPIYGDLAIINKLNNNDEGISANSALKFHKQFRHKPINLEHNKEVVVGHITHTAFSYYPMGFDEDNDKFIDAQNPFYLNFGGVVYSRIYKNVAKELILGQDPNAVSYKDICASWEIGFKEYDIVLGSRVLADAEIISDPDKVKEYSKYLKILGGSGKTPEGVFVGRLLKGELIPYGAGLTTKPAAKVDGVEVDYLYYELSAASLKLDNISEENKNKISHFNSDNVKEENTNTMDKEILEKLTKFEESLASLVTDKSSVQSFSSEIKTLIEDQGKTWQSKLEQKELESKELKEKTDSLSTSIASLEEQNKDYADRVSKLEKTLLDAENQQIKLARVDSIKNKFDLSTAELSIVSEELDAIASDADFNKYNSKLDVIFAAKNKSNQKIQESIASEVVTQTAPVVEEKKIEEALASAVEEPQTIPNTTTGTQKSLIQELTASWKAEDQVKVS